MDKVYINRDRHKFTNILKSNLGYYLVCIDIINFKKINDEFGFDNGDNLLQQILEFIYSLYSDKLRIDACRYEKDIIILMVDTKYDVYFFETVNKIINNKYIYDINFRVGYKKIDWEYKLDHFLDSINYIIKSKKYIVKSQFDKSFELSNDIEKYFAVKNDLMTNNSENFNLVYQPKISNKNKKINSCEILSRWNNPQIGEIYPNDFLPIIKSLGKEVEFDLMIFEKACIEVKSLGGIIGKFSINISIKSILSYKFLKDIYDLASRYNINTRDITLEIIEDICGYEQVDISSNIDELSRLGFSISIDDFGTGYSSYFRLAELNFSEVKIPKEFLRLDNKVGKAKNKKILSGIVSLCRELNCKIVIEGIETKEDVKLAESLKIDYIQGYYYSKPIDKIKYTELIKQCN